MGFFRPPVLVFPKFLIFPDDFCSTASNNPVMSCALVHDITSGGGWGVMSCRIWSLVRARIVRWTSHSGFFIFVDLVRWSPGRVGFWSRLLCCSSGGSAELLGFWSIEKSQLTQYHLKVKANISFAFGLVTLLSSLRNISNPLLHHTHNDTIESPQILLSVWAVIVWIGGVGLFPFSRRVMVQHLRWVKADKDISNQPIGLC